MPGSSVHGKIVFMNKDEHIIVMNFSGIYRQQFFQENEEQNKKISWVEVQDLPGSNCYCDEDALTHIREKIKEYGPEGIHFLDSGNYHYMSRIWMEKITVPFRLLVFDNHTDMQLPAFGGLLSCGGWIAAALEELPMLKEVILIGPDQSAFDQVEKGLQERVRFLSREILLDMDETETEAFLMSVSKDLPIYISVDKDVLCTEDAATIWSQGDMAFRALARYLNVIMKEQNVLTLDICGECDPDCLEHNDRNEYVNRELLNMWKEWRKHHEK